MAYRQITVTGGNLYQIAMQYLGYAPDWNRIAELNGIADPLILGTVTLQIPDPNPSLSSDGVWGQ